MCAFCGALVQERHWADGPERRDPEAEGAASWRQRRQAQVALANRILCQYGLEVRDWNAQLFVLTNRTGQSEVVPHLATLWSTAERLGQCRCDPLDPALLVRVEREGDLGAEPRRGT
jgi:hypothetical protein